MKTNRFSIEMLFLCNFKSNLQVVKFKEQLKIIEIISVHEIINVHSFVNATDVDKQRRINVIKLMYGWSFYKYSS